MKNIDFNAWRKDRKKHLAAHSDEDLLETMEERRFEARFPLEIFHDNIKPYITALHTDYNLPTSYIGLTMLSAYSTAIGTGYHIKMNKLGTIYFPIWACIEGISSSGKSLSYNQIYKPLERIQKEMEREWKEQIEHLSNDEIAKLPMKQVIYGEANIPTLIKTIMPHNPKGIVQDSDEILAWVNGMNALARSGKDGTDEQFWMKCWDAKPHRKLLSGNQFFVIPRPFLNVFGGAQPTVMWKLFKNDRDTTGFIFRLLFAVPEVSKIAEPNLLFDMPKEYEDIHFKSIERLYKEIEVNDADEDSRSLVIDTKAMRTFMEWSAMKVRKINNMEEEWQKEVHAGIIGKIKNYVLRFAGLLHLSDKAYNNEPFIYSGDVIHEDVMERAIKAGEYFYASAADISERVNKKMIASPDVLRWVSYVQLNMSNQEIGDMEYPKRSQEARRKAAAREKRRLIMEYPKLFKAKND